VYKRQGYRYAHDAATHYVAQEYLPESLRDTPLYQPGGMGFEKKIAERLEWWARLRREGG
jgi:putative ATPase